MKLLIIIAAFGVGLLPAMAQSYNFNVGGLQYSSGAAVPGSCSPDGKWFYKNTTTKGWSYCAGGAYVPATGGAGTVTSVTGTANQITSSGGATPTLSIPATFIGSGSVTATTTLGVVGATSGTATFTAPAIAGTSTNAVVTSNVFSAPIGLVTATSYGFTGFLNSGMYHNSFGTIIADGGANVIRAQSGFMGIGSGAVSYWTSTADVTGGSADTGLSRDSAGVVDVGTGAAASAAGSMKLTNLTASGTVNKLTLTAPATAATLTVPDGTTQTFPTVTSKVVGLLSAQAPAADTVACPNNTTGNFTSTYTIPANYLTANKVIRLTLGMTLLTSASPPNMALNLTIGGTAVVTPLPGAPSPSTGNRQVGMSYIIQGTAAAGASAGVMVHPVSGLVAGTTVSNPFAVSTITPPINLATNGTLAITPQLFCSVNTAGNSMTVQQFIVEALN